MTKSSKTNKLNNNSSIKSKKTNKLNNSSVKNKKTNKVNKATNKNKKTNKVNKISNKVKKNKKANKVKKTNTVKKINKVKKKKETKKTNVHKKYQNILARFEEKANSRGRDKFYDSIVRLLANVANKPYRRKEHETNMSKYKTEEEYQNSFDDVIQFSKKYTKANKMVDTIIYNKGNSDGLLSAYLVWDYVTEGGSNNKTIQLIELSPDNRKSGISSHISNQRQHIENKKVIVLDVSYNLDTYNFLKSNSKSLVYIDNHINQEIENKNNVLISKKSRNNRNKQRKAHATCALVYKFLYPKKEVPYVVQSIDSSDMNLYLKYIADPSPLNTAFSVLFSKNIVLKTPFSKINTLHNFMVTGSDIERFNYLAIVGQYMEKLRDNQKREAISTIRSG